MLLMSGANADTYEPAIEKSSGEKRPSEPKISASLPCSCICLPSCWAFAAICQGSNTTSVSSEIFDTIAEKSVCFWFTDSRLVDHVLGVGRTLDGVLGDDAREGRVVPALRQLGRGGGLGDEAHSRTVEQRPGGLDLLTPRGADHANDG